MSSDMIADRRHMDEITAGLPDNKSEKMRRLAAAGYTRSEIARYLGVRYQFVRNVLVAAEQSAESTQSIAKGEAAAKDGPRAGLTAKSEQAPKWVWMPVREDGTMIVPRAFLEAIEAGPGDEVQLTLSEGAVRILGRARALRALQDEVRRYVPEGVSLVDELLAERQVEATREKNGT